jgi:hypothetical protein
MMVRYLRKDSLRGNDIRANFGLVDIPYSPLDVIEILELDKNQLAIKNISLGIDELTVFADCRVSVSKMNRIFSYFILQTRKRSVNLYFTTQNLDMIDKRVLNHLDISVYCEKVKDQQGNEVEGLRKYTIWDFRDTHNIPRPKKILLDITKYYKYYDTNEVIMPVY